MNLWKYQEESGDFYKVLYKGRVGYVSKKFVSVAGESASTNTVETTNTTSSTNTTTSTTNVTTTTEATTTAANSDNSNLAIGSYKLSADSDVYVLPVLYAIKNGSLKKGDTVNIITVTANWVYISIIIYLVGFLKLQLMELIKKKQLLQLQQQRLL